MKFFREMKEMLVDIYKTFTYKDNYPGPNQKMIEMRKEYVEIQRKKKEVDKE